jgi:hypothetical protein
MSSTGQTQDATTTTTTMATTTTRHPVAVCPVCFCQNVLLTLSGWSQELTALLNRPFEALEERRRLARRRERARENIARMSRQLKLDLASVELERRREAEREWGDELERRRIELEGERLKGYREAWEQRKALKRERAESAPTYKGKGKAKDI